jgi:cysteinyl-tRNA synthetase
MVKTAIQLHNSLTGRKEAFAPADPAHVRVYACGPTVYSYAHIGNGRMAVVFDLLVRVLRRRYPKVTYVSNITDVDDKIMAAAAETGMPIAELTQKFTDIYNGDMRALGANLPDVQPRATAHIGDMIALIETLIQRGHAYAAEGHVLFNVPSFPAYGRLSGRSRDDQVAGARVEVAPYKKDPADFVLWKPSSEAQPGWDSPWGRGRPGWHIECSAMAERHLGLPFDIHGGGADLKFPHHENEIAQSCCAHGAEDDLAAFARFWVHNGFVTVEGEKMSKSVGNIALVHDLIAHYPGEVLRLTLLSAHYRQPLNWTQEKIAAEKQALDRLYRAVYELSQGARHPAPLDAEHVPDEFMEALCDDLNTPKAISFLHELAGQAASMKTPQEKTALRNRLLACGELLGILGEGAAEWLGFGVAASGTEAARIDALLAERQQARAAKNFARADEIRAELEEAGIVIEDTPQGPKWRKAG